MATNTSTATATCTYCTNAFIDPRMLNCLHSYCKDCLDKYHDKQENNQSSIKCPDCGIITPLPDNQVKLLPKDLRGSYEADIARYQSKVKSEKKVECDRCVEPENGPAVSFCCNDCEFLCKVCTKDHKTWKKTLHHELVSLSGKKFNKEVLKNIPHALVACNNHPDINLTFFCETHRILTCRDCVVLEHKECQYKRIETIVEQERSDLLNSLGKVQEIRGKIEDSINQSEKITQRVQATQNSVDDEIKSTFKALRETLAKRESDLLAKSSDIVLGKLTALQMQREDLTKFHDEVASTCIRVTSAARVYTPAEMLSTKAAMTTKIEYLLKVFRETILDPCKCEIMPTEMKSMSLLQDIESFGQVIGGCSPSLSIATTIQYKPQAVKDKERKFIIQAMGADGKPYHRGGEPVHASLRVKGSDESPIMLAIVDNNDGTYSTSFTASTTGFHILTVTISNEHIQGSPFLIYIREPRDYKTFQNPSQVFSTPNSIRGLAIDEDSNIYVTIDDHSVGIYNKNGDSMKTIGIPGTNSSENGQFWYPSELALKRELMYVVEENNHRVQKLNLDGEYVSEFGENGSGRGQLSSPRGICISPQGKIFVTESGNHRVSVFNPDGEFDCFIQGSGEAELKNPCGITFGTGGLLHIVSQGNNSVKVFSEKGEYKFKYGDNKLSSSPSGICIDQDGFTFVSNFGGSSARIEVFDSEHSHHHTIQGSLNNAWAMAFDKDGILFVADRGNKRVVKY